jgi:hypothetical protein
MKLVIADEKASPCPGGVCFEVRVNQVKGFSEIGTPEARGVPISQYCDWPPLALPAQR